MEQQKVRIGVAGVANHGRTIINAIRESGMFDLISCYDVDHKALEEVVMDFGIRVATSWEDFVSEPALEAVAIVSPNHLHADQMWDALTVKKHIFVEKPIAVTLREAGEVLRLARRKERVVLVGHNTRRKRVFREAKNILAEGRIGKIVAVEANMSRHVGLEEGLPDWKADPAKCRLLPMTQLGIHFVDVVHYLFSPIKKVYCVVHNAAMKNSVVDTVSAVLQTSGGIPVSLASSYVTPDVYRFCVYGTEGILRCYSYSLELEIRHPWEVIEMDFSSEGAESYVLQMKEFAECIRTGARPETGGKEALQALAVIEAMAESATIESSIEINQIWSEGT